MSSPYFVLRKEVVILSKVMRISGNFEKAGKWSDSIFNGYIIVEDNGYFVGYQDEFCLNTDETAHKESGNYLEWFITGYIVNNGRDGAEGIAYYKLPIKEDRLPILHVIPNHIEKGDWSEIEPEGCLAPQGVVLVLLEDAFGVDGSIIEKISEAYSQVNSGDSVMNKELLEQVDACLYLLKSAEFW